MTAAIPARDWRSFFGDPTSFIAILFLGLVALPIGLVIYTVMIDAAAVVLTAHTRLIDAFVDNILAHAHLIKALMNPFLETFAKKAGN